MKQAAVPKKGDGGLFERKKGEEKESGPVEARH